MPEVPKSLEEAIAQAQLATQSALDAGFKRLQVELVIPEIALEAQSLALQFASLFESYGSGLKIVFPDAGAAALARRDWGETVFRIGDLGSRYIPVEAKIAAEDEAFLVVCPSSAEIKAVEKLCEIASEGDRPVLLLIPQLEDVAIVGIGYAARQLRERFLNTLESCYYFRPVEGAVILRSYPSLWQVWLEKDEGYELIAEENQRPMGEALELTIAKARGDIPDATVPQPKKGGLFTDMQRLFKALRQ